MINIRKLESELWESADLLRANSRLTSNEYCMPVLGLIFLRYAYSRFLYVEAEIMKNRPLRAGRPLPVEVGDFIKRSALFLPEKARYDYLLNLPEGEDLGKAVNTAMELVEEQSAQLTGVLPKTYTTFQDELLGQLLRIFNNSAFNEIKDDVIGRIYEYFLNKFAPVVASDDGVFFTPKSLVRMIVNIIEPTHGTVLDPACGSGGMFVSSSDFVEQLGTRTNTAMTFYGQEKVDYNAKLCVMNMAVHGLNAKIISGDEANSFFNDHFNLDGNCDYVMANPPFNVDKVNAESAQNAGRLPFGLPGVNKNQEVSNANYLWISYFYSYLKETGRAGFVMAASATDSASKDRLIRQQLVETGHVDVMMSVGNNFFYTKSLPCTLWFFDKGKPEERQDQVLFIDARNYFTVVDRTLNEWSEWQMKNLNAIVWLYRGETEKFEELIIDYRAHIVSECYELDADFEGLSELLSVHGEDPAKRRLDIAQTIERVDHIKQLLPLDEMLEQYVAMLNASLSAFVIYGDGLARDKAKELANSKDNTATTWPRFKKKTTEQVQEVMARIEACRVVITEAKWLTERFGEGEYTDIPGMCKLASRADIEGKNWSLTPGAYVGVEPPKNDGVDYGERMREIHQELMTLQAKSNRLMDTISKNFKEMGL